MLPLQGFATGVIADVLRRQPSSPGKTQFVWTAAVGPALARATSAVELRDRVLYVTPKDARWAREIERAADTILARLKILLGADSVIDLQVRHLQ